MTRRRMESGFNVCLRPAIGTGDAYSRSVAWCVRTFHRAWTSASALIANRQISVGGRK
jgi:hypothetical protein